MKRNTGIMVLAMFAAVIAFGATNYVQEGDVITLTWATTSPTAGDPVVKGTSKAAGCIVGVALNGSAVAAESVQVATKGVFRLMVAPAAGNIAIGDYIYGSVAGDVGVCTTALTNTNTGILFGQSLSAATSSTTARLMTVMLRQPGHL